MVTIVQVDPALVEDLRELALDFRRTHDHDEGIWLGRGARVAVRNDEEGLDRVGHVRVPPDLQSAHDAHADSRYWARWLER